MQHGRMPADLEILIFVVSSRKTAVYLIKAQFKILKPNFVDSGKYFII